MMITKHFLPHRRLGSPQIGETIRLRGNKETIYILLGEDPKSWPFFIRVPTNSITNEMRRIAQKPKWTYTIFIVLAKNSKWGGLAIYLCKAVQR